MISAMFERFVENTPMTVMVRAMMERIFAPPLLDQLFEETAEQQYQRELLFSSVVGLMSLVVCGMYPSLNAAYKGFEKVIGVSKVALYAKVNGLEPKLSQALVRYSSEQLLAVHQEFPAAEPVLAGYEVRIIDGNHIAGTEHRLKVLRNEPAGALPGQTLSVLDPQRSLVVDVFPCEDGHAQERSMLPQVLEQVHPQQLWIADRNFCTSDFLSQIAQRQACFIIREHQQMAWRAVTPLVAAGENERGRLFEQQVQLSSGLQIRRIVIELKQATRHGDQQVAVLTNLPMASADASTVADLYLKRWRIESMFQTITDTFHCELNTLGYPRAALFVFCVALVAFNILATVRAVLKQVHGAAVIEEQLSDYYVVEDIQATWRGLEIAILAQDWQVFRAMDRVAFAQCLRQWAERVNLQRFRKSKRGQKKPTTKKPFDPKHPHVATARLLKPE